ncbi:YdcF family protein [Nicoliella spurrieriana]|uniref:YdcF family protein n=1 Tax=Nicoliella spurrieriana TaxID=2925830 RepID=UPI0021A7EE8E|nr:YdcF family protein [Nicoliella spurrieriana]
MITFSLIVISINNQILVDGYVILFIFVLFLFLLVYLFQGFFWLWNAWIVWQRENHSLANMLTLFLGIVTLIFPIANLLLAKHSFGAIGTFFSTFWVLTILYGLFCIFSFMLAALLFTIKKPKPDKQYIIILGAGLLNGNQVSPLLASRIDKGIQFYHQVLSKTGHAPLLICSGGQGNDETIPEGVAMREYAITHGIPAEQVIAERQSKTTLQNMLFSKQVVVERQLPLTAGVYVTNDYHVFRAGIYARRSGLNIQGIGAKTSKFFVPNATIREYIALLMNHRLFHVVVFGMIIVVALLSAILG